jgi:glyoxylase-like metal-dependent hydrolase (beta-lactamase superfamily II)
LAAALQGLSVSHIVVTHTHKDHTGAVAALKALTGAAVVGAGPHIAARPLALGEINPLDAASDGDYRPDRMLADGETLEGPGWTLEAVATPGHTANHLCFALKQERALFSGDHVMAWSTSIVAPPDGAMGDYLASLERLKGRDEAVFWPGHGGPVTDPGRFVRGLITHRRMREASILHRLRAGDRRIGEIVPKVYEGLDPALMGAAALSTFAQIEHLVASGLVRSLEGPPTLDGAFAPV